MRSAIRLIALLAAMSLALPAMAHGDHDARPLLRRAEVGPYTVSLWQVYPDVGSAIIPHLIVMFDDGMPDEGTVVSVQVGSENVHVMSSVTTPGAWETMTGVEPDDVVSVTISERGEAWSAPDRGDPAPAHVCLTDAGFDRDIYLPRHRRGLVDRWQDGAGMAAADHVPERGTRGLNRRTGRWLGRRSRPRSWASSRS